MNQPENLTCDRRRLARPMRWLFLVASLLLSGACGGAGGCGGCGSTEPLPGGALPADQTVEGGGQVRVTPSGMAKINQLARSTVESALGEGFCVPETELGNATGTLGTGVLLCRNNQNQCVPGCDVDITFDSILLAAAGPQTLRLSAQVDAVTSVPLNFQVIGIPGSCTLGVRANNTAIQADITVGITASNGELLLRVEPIVRPTLALQFSGCSLVSSILNLLSSFLEDTIVDAILDVLQPTLENLVRDLLPNPLGIAGMIDVGTLLSGLTSGAVGALETRVLPGGYVHFTPDDGGLSLGLITGFNADRDPSTRTPTLDSEPARCVPALPPPNFATGPRSLPTVPNRMTFGLPVAAAFDGRPNPADADLAIGLSETMFNLLGHHLVTSGAVCLGIGTSQVAQLNLATFGLVSPSLAQLGSESRNDPVLLVTRPTSAVTFVVGEGDTASPALTMTLKDFDVDVYAFLYERYTRAFTMSLSLDIGINLEFEQVAGQPVSIKPVLLGISSRNVKVKVQNSEFVRETTTELEAVLPVVFDLVTPLLGNLPSITLPAFAGFALQDLSVRKTTTTEGSFLAVTASLGASTLAAQPMLASPSPPRRAGGSARLRSVEVPGLDDVRSALIDSASRGGQLPTITIDVDRHDDLGRELEWSWRIGHGLWRPYSQAAPLIIRDRSLAFQGDLTIGVMSRVKGDYRTVSAETEIAVRIDSVGPHLVQAATRWQDGELSVVGFDIVAGRDLSIAFATPGADQPGTAWQQGAAATLDAQTAQRLARDGEVSVFLRDPSGNVSVELVAPSAAFHGDAGGGACNSAGGPGAGGWVLLLLTGGALLLRRRRTTVDDSLPSMASRPLRSSVSSPLAQLASGAHTVALWLLIAVASSLVPGCDCGGNASRACELVQDCAGFCPAGDVAFCIEGTCICADDIEPGKIGPYSDIAVSPKGGAWVAAYAQTHGDLVVVHAAAPGRVLAESWEWVDGVPDGPIAVENARIRGGIAADGPDIGMYTSIAVTQADEPMVSYFDRESASLRFASKVGGSWKKHVVDAGTGTLTGDSGALVGMYTSLTLRSDDGRPGIAYLAHVKTTAGTQAEVRFASAQVPYPSSAADWLIKVVDTAPIPIPSADDPNIYPLPNGLGLFVDSARLGNQAPVVVYYDRSNGALKMSTFNPTQNRFDAPAVIGGGANEDAGWSPTIAVDAVGKIHVAYVGAARDDLEYLKVSTLARPEIVDDGYRIVGQTGDGLPKPEFHFVGDDASLVVTLNGQPVITYQDATSHELLVARRSISGTWTRSTVAGAEDPFVGAFGFFAASAATSSKLLISSWVLDPSIDEQWVEIFERPLVE